MSKVFFVIILSVCSLPILGQEYPEFSIRRSDDISLKYEKCNNLDLLVFDLVLKNKRKEASAFIEQETNTCFLEMFEQALRSIDYMAKEERLLNCSIFKAFCYEPSEDKELLYWLDWTSQYEDCYDPTISVYITRKDCFSFIVLAPSFYNFTKTF